MEYTKGEWKVEEVGDCSLIMMDNQTCVARTFKTYYPTEAEEANAHLIAAAPEIYEALKRLMEALEEHGSVHNDVRIAYNLTKPALAKAEGK